LLTVVVPHPLRPQRRAKPALGCFHDQHPGPQLLSGSQRAKRRALAIARARRCQGKGRGVTPEPAVLCAPGKCPVSVICPKMGRPAPVQAVHGSAEKGRDSAAPRQRNRETQPASPRPACWPPRPCACLWSFPHAPTNKKSLATPACAFSEWFRTRLKPPPEVQGAGQTLGASKKCVPTENPGRRLQWHRGHCSSIDKKG
jgi:hypothetical protein